MDVNVVTSGDVGKGLLIASGFLDVTISASISFDGVYGLLYTLDSDLKNISMLPYNTTPSYINIDNNQFRNIDNPTLKILIDLPPYSATQKMIYNMNTSTIQNVTANSNDVYLDYYQNTTPSTPASGVKLYNKYGHICSITPEGFEYLIKDDEHFMTQTTSVMVNPGGTLTYKNSDTWALLPTGQVANNINGSSKTFQNITRDLTANNGADVRFYSNTLQCWIGNSIGLGGFRANFKFGVADTTFCSDGRLFVGLHSSAVAPTSTTNILTLTNFIAIVQEPSISADSKLYFIVNGTSSSALMYQYTGMELVNNTLYEFFIYVPPFSNKIYMWLINLETLQEAYWVADASSMASQYYPSKSAFFAPKMYRRDINVGANPTLLFSHYTLDLLQP